MTDIVTRLRDWRNVHLALLMEEAADEVAILRADNSRRANLEKGLRDGIVRLSANGDCPAPDNAANEENNDRLAALEALAGLDEELSLPRRTLATHATPREGREQDGCTLTDAEREAVQWAAAMEPEPNGRWTKAQEKTWNKRAATLRGLLERME